MSDIRTAAADVVKATRAIEGLKAERDDALLNLLSPEQKQAKAEMEAEYNTAILGGEAELEAAKAEAKAEVLAVGETFKAEGIQIQYVRGSEGWDGKKLDKLIEMPRTVGNDKIADAVEACRKPAGSPSVRFVFKEG